MMEKTTTARIKQLGRALAVVCRITRLMFSVAGIAALAGSIVSLIKPDFIEYFEGMYLPQSEG